MDADEALDALDAYASAATKHQESLITKHEESLMFDTQTDLYK
jgi:hypothetical protein